MKIIITGSLGHIGKPLTQELVQKGHTVTVISSNPEKQKDIEALGAGAAIGSVDDVDFLTITFKDADAVFTMVPPNNYFDHSLDLLAYYRRLGQNYVEAISKTGVKRVVNLSSIGAHMEQGSGILIGAHDVEQILNDGVSAGVAITHMRPTSFYYNLFGYSNMIKNAGYIAANYGGDDVVPWVSPVDIAAAVAEELTSNNHTKIRYVASEELTCSETARILGEAIGKPDLQWITIPGEESLNGLVAIGMNPKIAAGLVEMYEGFHTGLLSEDYNRNRPTVMGKVKLADFAKEFAASFK